jgi:hypothetical protein
VASWQVLGGPAATGLTVLGAGRRTGFETTLTVPRVAYVAVRALDAAGNVLASSATIAPGR